MTDVVAADEQSAEAIDLARWTALAEAVLRAEGASAPGELSLLFVDAGEMARLNEQFMSASGPTDVLAFPLDPLGSSDVPLLLGDVVICPAVAAANAPTHAGNLDDEIALLIVHGILHVLGHDHAEPAETAVMRSRERALLEKLHWCGSAPVGFRADED